jgi:polysaccharide biosynthesis transport protein
MFQRMRLNNLVDNSNEHSVSQLISALRRQAGVVIAFCVLGTILGIVYVVNATPLYTASADVMIDNRQIRAVRDVSTFLEQQVDASAINTEVESQVEIFRSEKVGLDVVKRLNLSEDPDFFDPPKSMIDKVLRNIVGFKSQSLYGPEASVARQLEALKTLNYNLRIDRVGRTFLIEVNYSSPDAARAAEIANGYANAFMFEQLSTHIEATRNARAWLEQRTEDLRKLSVDADFSAQKFKAENNLLQAKGTLIYEQQFNEMTTQLVAAQATTAQAKARYLHLKDIIDTRKTESAVTESLQDPIINGLRTKYLEISNRMKDLQSALRLSMSHDVIVNLKNEMTELSAKLFEELGRVAESYRNDYEVAAARERSINDALKRQRSIAVTANDAQVQLRQLEQRADSYKMLYQTYLQRYQETAQQESYPLTESHVVSGAVPPPTPTYPKKPIVLAVALAIGALVGVCVGMLREIMDRVFRTSEQVRDVLGVDVLGMLPLLSQETFAGRTSIAPIMRYAIDYPFSAFAETLRSAKVAADLALNDKSTKTIGMISLLPKEGKSTVSKNFASSLALQGFKTLLIDADTRNPALTHAIGHDRRQESQAGTMPPLGKLLHLEIDSGLDILPCIYSKDDPRVANGLSSTSLSYLLKSSDKPFDYIVIDLPPIGPVVSARELASVIDAFIFVVAWGETSRGAVKAVLAQEHSIRNKLLGVILNKVDMNKLKIYEHFGSDGYYHRLYRNYYKKAE